MMLGLAAASSALDLINKLTSSSSAQKTAGKTGFSVNANATSSAASSGSSGQTSLIAPDTMNALLAAQSQNSVSSTAPVSPFDALKNLFNKLDADSSGQISKSEFETALGAGGTNVANADSVFGKMDANGDGSISLDEMALALKPKHKARGEKSGGPQDALMQMLDSANATSTNADGSVTSTMTLADGSTVTMTTPASASQSSSATRSYNAIEQMLQQQANMVTRPTSASSSLSVSV